MSGESNSTHAALSVAKSTVKEPAPLAVTDGEAVMSDARPANDDAGVPGMSAALTGSTSYSCRSVRFAPLPQRYATSGSGDSGTAGPLKAPLLRYAYGSMEGSSPTRTADTRAGVGADGDAAASATSASDADASGSDDEGILSILINMTRR